jgi:hypothetical protein
MTLLPNFKVMWSKMATTQKNLNFLVFKVLLTPQKNYTLTKQLYIVEYVVFSWKKAVWDIIITFFRLWALFRWNGIGLNCWLFHQTKTVSLVSSKFVRRWRYHIRNWICGVAQMPYASWDRIKCNNTWGISERSFCSAIGCHFWYCPAF